MTLPDNKPAGAVTVLITRRVISGHEAAFEEASGHITTAASEFAGYLGGQFVRPNAQDGDDPALYNVVFAFDTPGHLQRWQDSAARALGMAAIAPHIEGQTLLQVSGLGHWFAAPVGPKPLAPPPRWKVAVVTWLGICPTVFVLFVVLGELLAPWPLLPRVMVLTGLVVLIMTWLVAPQLTRVLKPWLYPPARESH